MAQMLVFFLVLAAFLANNHALVRLPMERYVIPGMEGRGLIPVPIKNIGIRYTVPVGFGHDLADYNLVVDTGSTNIWVGSPDCQSCGFKKTHRCENPTRHSTTVSYLAGYGSGHFCKEDLRISGMTVRDQEYLTIEEGRALANTKVGDGIIGFGPESGSFGYPLVVNGLLTVHKPHSVMRNLLEQGLIETPSFSLYLSRSGHNELIIGGVDKNFYIGEMAFATRVDDKSWTISVDGVTIGDTMVCGPGQCTALPDTGTPDAVAIPYKYAHVLDRQMLQAGAKKTNTFSQGLVDGSKFLFYTYSLTPYTNIDLLPRFYFTIGGFTFVLTGRDYVDKDTINITVNSAIPHFILGDYFLHKVYTTYDLANRRVGFAYARHQ